MAEWAKWAAFFLCVCDSELSLFLKKTIKIFLGRGQNSDSDYQCDDEKTLTQTGPEVSMWHVARSGCIDAEWSWGPGLCEKLVELMEENEDIIDEP